jgi:uncharacterized protein (TIGR02466 family)
MKIEVTQAFPTWIGRLKVPDAETMNWELGSLVLAEETRHATVGRSNIGGWHSRTDFLNHPEPAVAALTNWINWAVRQMVNATTASDTFQGTLLISAWAAICRTGAYHAPHSHPDSAWSGVYYVDAGTEDPAHPLSGVLEFLDPRAGVEAVTAPGDPYGQPVRVWPEDGSIVIFPSWLYHWVHPYTGPTPRIAISFNASVAPVTGAEDTTADTILSVER